MCYVDQHLAPFYSHTGSPSIDPELLIRTLIGGYFFGIRSERQLYEEVTEPGVSVVRLNSCSPPNRSRRAESPRKIKLAALINCPGPLLAQVVGELGWSIAHGHDSKLEKTLTNIIGA